MNKTNINKRVSSLECEVTTDFPYEGDMDIIKQLKEVKKHNKVASAVQDLIGGKKKRKRESFIVD